MTGDEFDKAIIDGAVKLMHENNRKFLERGGMILAKEFEGELWVRASDIEKKLKYAVADEREACADLAENWRCNGMPRTILAEQIRARGQE